MVTQEEFINRAIEIHGNKYDYSKTKFNGFLRKIKINCKVHGEFEQYPQHHLRGSGCSYCVNMVRLTNQQFIDKAKSVHGDKYSYFKTEFKALKMNITITCPIHGDFEQRSDVHINGSGCHDCFSDSRKSNMIEFIEKAREVHGDKYDYSKINYINKETKIIIICPVHGSFQQRPGSHLSGSGCNKCGEDRTRLLQDEFITKAKLVHNNRYNYDKVNYINTKTSVTIICPIHGEFEQIPNRHLAGAGCFICKASKGELAIKAILDKHNIEHVQEYRIPEVIARLSYDFYIPKYSLLIEFHGKQHYEYIPHFHYNDEDNFLKQKNRDDMIRSNASQFKYRYLEFNYKQLKHMSKDEFEELVINKINLFKKKG